MSEPAPGSSPPGTAGAGAGAGAPARAKALLAIREEVPAWLKWGLGVIPILALILVW